MVDFSNKRVLITHTMIAQIMGSTVVAAQLAHALQGKGAEVIVFASTYEYPARALFEKNNITVVVGESLESDLWSFDYVWVNSQILPLNIVQDLDAYNQAPDDEQVKLMAQMPCFIFNHMGAMEEVSDEYPYIPLLEETIASLEVFVSPEAHDAMRPYYNEALNAIVPQVVFPNPAPTEFAFGRKFAVDKAAPSSILVVSSHVPQELCDAMVLLQERGYNVEHIGTGGDEREVTPSVIEQADVVITIGKTVQYCLLSATPVFIYDYLGGFGYLDKDNFSIAQYANFSGRGGTTMTADVIVETLIEGYKSALEYFAANVAYWREQYALDAKIDMVFEAAQPRDIVSFPYKGYTKVLKQQERFALRNWQIWAHQIALLDLKEIQKETIDQLTQDLDRVIASTSFKAGRALTLPVRLMKDFFSK